jgi:hypothetical protein
MWGWFSYGGARMKIIASFIKSTTKTSCRVEVSEAMQRIGALLDPSVVLL